MTCNWVLPSVSIPAETTSAATTGATDTPAGAERKEVAGVGMVLGALLAVMGLL